MNTGEKMHVWKHTILTHWLRNQHGKVYYALEGSIFIAGSAIQASWRSSRGWKFTRIWKIYAYDSQQHDEVCRSTANTGLGAP